MPDYALEIAALRAALAACEKHSFNPQRCEDVYDCITLLTNAMHRDGVLVEHVIVAVRPIIQQYPRTGIDEEALIRHAIVQYYSDRIPPVR